LQTRQGQRCEGRDLEKGRTRRGSPAEIDRRVAGSFRNFQFMEKIRGIFFWGGARSSEKGLRVRVHAHGRREEALGKSLRRGTATSLKNHPGLGEREVPQICPGNPPVGNPREGRAITDHKQVTPQETRYCFLENNRRGVAG